MWQHAPIRVEGFFAAGRTGAPQIDSGPIPRLIPAVSRLRQLVALAVLALWLPATLHCTFEAAGLLQDKCCPASHAASAPEDCATDACDTAEGAFTKPQSFALAAPAPLLCACFVGSPLAAPPLLLTAPPVTGLAEASGAPPGLNRTWVFVVRAAPQPGAPSLAS